jgi:hypothetical protein
LTVGPAEIDTLREIENRVLPLPLVPGVARYESLPDYYWSSNIALRYRFDEAVRAFNSGKPGRYRAMTVVAGPAGVGKTFIKGSVYRDWIPEDKVRKFDIREVLGDLAEKGLAEYKPDIEHDGEAISRLLSLTPEGREQFLPALDLDSSAFLVVDSLDEVHPDDYFFVLSALEQYALYGNREFIHVVVFGRPLVFREYWRDRRSAGIPEGLRGYVLNPPDFRTTGDLMVSSWNFNCWKYGLSRMDIDGERRSMRLSDFQRWSDCDFDTSGEFSDVAHKDAHCFCPEVRDVLTTWARQHRVVAAVLPNLAGNSIVREIVDQCVDQGREFDERQFMESYFASWLERDTKSGDRPSNVKARHLDLYMKLMEAVAAKYIDEHRLSREGYFDVIDDDRVVIEHEGKTVSVPVERLLNRSGLVTLDPVLPVAARYRFEPFWFHRLLLLKHHERQAKQGRQVIISVPAGT